MKEYIYTQEAPEPIGPYSQAIKFNSNLIFTSGQIAIDPKTGNLNGGYIREQTHQVMENIKKVLTAGGSDITKVIKTMVFLKNMEDFPEMNAVYTEYFDEIKPARSTVQAARLPKDALVEIEVIAYI